LESTSLEIASVRLGQLIGGREVPADREIEVRNPSRGSELVGCVADGTAHDVDAAVEAAVAVAPEWAATSPQTRIDLFARIADEIDAQAEDLATLVARENGSVRPIVRRELIGAAAAFRDVAGYLIEKLSPAEHPSGGSGEFVRVHRRPFGVVACVVPWNAPLILTANKIAPALAAGECGGAETLPFRAPRGDADRTHRRIHPSARGREHRQRRRRGGCRAHRPS
jgi:aldehyde dehydrogenase (NAD+)